MNLDLYEMAASPARYSKIRAGVSSSLFPRTIKLSYVNRKIYISTPSDPVTLTVGVAVSILRRVSQRSSKMSAKNVVQYIDVGKTFFNMWQNNYKYGNNCRLCVNDKGVQKETYILIETNKEEIERKKVGVDEMKDKRTIIT